MLYNNILPKIKDKVVFITEGRNEWERRTIHSRAGKQTGKYKNWINIIDEKGNRKHWLEVNKIVVKGLGRVQQSFLLRNNTKEKETKEAKVN